MELTSREFVRFQSHLEPDGDCLIWSLMKNPGGYGVVGIHGKLYLVHRISWLIAGFEIPPRFDVCHHCDNRACGRLAHLWVGTRKENMEDCASKGRLATGERHGSRTYPESRTIGRRNPQAKLSEGDVIQIRALASQGVDPEDLARQFLVTASNIYKVVSRETWRHV